MIKKVHLRLTLFCMIITGAILVCLSLICLHINEKNLNQNADMIFQNQLYSILSYLELQDYVSTEWLSTTENNKKIILDIEDTGYPLIYSDLSHSSEEQRLISESREYTLLNYDFDISKSSTTNITEHIEFKLSDNNDDYVVSAIVIPKKAGFLSVILLYSLKNLQIQIMNQRILFFILDLIGLFLLALFSWIFTKKILLPVEISKMRQTEFIATASHELRTPLMVILSNLNAMDETDTIHFPKFKNAIHTESIKMSHLVNDMLTLARTDNNIWDLEIKDVALDTLLVNIFEKYENLAKEKNILLSFELPEDLMEQYPCDSMKMEQAISILLDNALSYTPKGGAVRLTIKVLKNVIEVNVIDNGAGVPDAEKEAIFERFIRRDKSHTEEEHFGLGLCIAKEIIKKHKGKLYVADTEGGGATFVISLPLLPSKKQYH